MKFEVPVAETANCPPSLHSGERGVKREGTKNVDLTSQLDKICPCALGQFNKFNFLSFYGGVVMTSRIFYFLFSQQSVWVFTDTRLTR